MWLECRAVIGCIRSVGAEREAKSDDANSLCKPARTCFLQLCTKQQAQFSDYGNSTKGLPRQHPRVSAHKCLANIEHILLSRYRSRYSQENIILVSIP